MDAKFCAFQGSLYAYSEYNEGTNRERQSWKHKIKQNSIWLSVNFLIITLKALQKIK